MKKKYLILFLGILYTSVQIIAANSGRLPIALFIENKGQIVDQDNNVNNEVLFLANLAGMKIQIKRDGFSYEKEMANSLLDDSLSTTTYRTDIKFYKSNNKVEVVGSNQSNGYVNYYLHHTGLAGVNNVRTFEKVRYLNLYPHIDLELSVRDGKLKYEFIVDKGGNSEQIMFEIIGGDGVTVNANNELELATPAGLIKENAPVSYYSSDHESLVSTNFVLLNNRFISFKLGKYDKEQKLIIDPSVLWGTYYGGTDTEESNDIAVDPNNNIFITGYTPSNTNIASVGAHQTTYMGGQKDAYVAKFDSMGQLVWATYLGGTGEDRGYEVACDNSGNVYMTGVSWSTTGIATPGAYLTVNPPGFGKAMIEKFNAQGQRVWGTYTLGGHGFGITIDNSNSILQCGYTSSSTGVASPGTFQQTLAGTSDGYIVKFTAQGQFIWGTYYGGATGYDYCEGITTDSQNNIYVCGWGTSITGLGTAGTHLQSVASVTNGIAFLAKFTPTGQRVWGTYYGCTYENTAEGIVVISDTAVYISGVTACSTDIATPGVYMSTYPGGYARYIARFDTTGNLTWGTYVNQTSDNTGEELSRDASGNLCVSGLCGSVPNFSTPDAIQLNPYPIYTNGCVAIVNSNGQKVFATYIGGASGAPVRATVFDHSDNLIITGHSYGSNTVGTPGTYQPVNSNAGYSDAYVMKIVLKCNSTYPTFKIIGDSSFCPYTKNIILKLDTFAKSSVWQLPVGSTINFVRKDSISFNLGALGGIVKAYIQDSCGQSSPSSMNITVKPNPGAISIKGDTFYCSGRNILLYVNNPNHAAITWNSPVGPIIGGDSLRLVALLSNIGQYKVTADLNGCSVSDTQQVQILQTLHPAIIGDTSLCKGDSLILVGSGCTSYFWSTGQTDSSIFIKPTTTTTFFLTSKSVCSDTASKTIQVHPKPTVSITGPSPICRGESVSLTATGTGQFVWSTGATSSTIVVSPVQTATYTVSASDLFCSKDTSFSITVNTVPVGQITGDTILCVGDSTILSASGGQNYLWNTGQTTASIKIAPQNSTAYSVIISNGNCSDTVEANVSVHSIPTVSITGTSPICRGESVSLTATGTGQFVWSTGATSSTIVVSPVQTATYTVSASDLFCSKDTSFSITVNTVPVGQITGDTILCVGDSIILSASGGQNYLWNTGQTTASIKIAPQNSTAYSVIISNGNCSDTVEANVSVHSIPTVSITGTSPICRGESVSLTATGTGQFVWSTGATSSTIVVSPVQTATYTVSASDLFCSKDTSFSITVNTVPVGQITGDTILCIGDSTILSASGGQNYLWNTGQTTTSIKIAPQNSTAYSVIISNGNCSDTVEANVSVHSIPTVSITGTSPICRGESVSLTAIGTGQFVWSTGATSSTIVVSPVQTATYTVSASDLFCSKDTSFSITVNTVPVGQITGDTILCVGDSTILSASGGQNYLWNNGNTSSTIKVMPTNNTVYSVTVSNAFCADTTFTNVNVYTMPVGSIIGNNQLCSGQSTTLSASGGVLYLWNTGLTSPSLSVNPLDTTEYFVYVSNGFCFDTVYYTVNVTHTPDVSISGDTFVCEGDSLLLLASGGSSYYWSTGATKDSILVTPSSNTIISLIASNGSCFDTVYSSIEVKQNNFANAGKDTTICFGSSVLLTASGGTSYQWLAGDGLLTTQGSQAIATPLNSTDYIVEAYFRNCKAIDTVHVSLLPLPSLLLSTQKDTIAYGETSILNASGTSSYSWQPNDGSLSCNNCPNPTVQPQHSTMYYVMGMNNFGCITIDSMFITVLEREQRSRCPSPLMPNAFTPDKDGVNDMIGPAMNCVKKIISFSIYNRWGRKVFDNSNGEEKWDGNFDGSQMPMSVYVYTLNVILLDGTNIQENGNITLIR